MNWEEFMGLGRAVGNVQDQEVQEVKLSLNGAAALANTVLYLSQTTQYFL